MNTSNNERRRFKRVLFSIEEGIEGNFTPSGLKSEVITASILNLSEGGLGLNFKNTDTDSIREGDHFILKNISGPEALQAITDIEAEIMWILPYHPSRGLRSGCRFLNISHSEKEHIQKFVNTWIQNKLGTT
jgi:c-di-GMP-binding flagellar brake protein YcgR